MKPRVRIAVIIPAGPGEDVLDTLASVVHYTDPSRVILVIDDSSPLRGNSHRLRDLSQDIIVIPAQGAPGRRGYLWVKLAAGYRWLLERFEPGIVLRMDTDALLIGHGLEAAAEQAFTERPRIGLIGSYMIGPDGGHRDFSSAAQQLRAETGIRGLIHPQRRSRLRHHVRLARRHGYIEGAHALGGAYIHSHAAVNWICENGLFSQPCLATSQLAEDHIMALLTMAGGYRIQDFGGPDQPMALWWRGLPAHPEDLLAAGKLITHSVRSWQDLDEQRIRSIFAEARDRESRR
jgi:hypothetical protein